MTDLFHGCAWAKPKSTDDIMSYCRRSAEWPQSYLAFVDQMNGPPRSWEMDPRRPRSTWMCIHPLTGQVVGGGVDGIVTGMVLCDAQLEAWGVVLLGSIRKPEETP